MISFKIKAFTNPSYILKLLSEAKKWIVSSIPQVRGWEEKAAEKAAWAAGFGSHPQLLSRRVILAKLRNTFQ